MNISERVKAGIISVSLGLIADAIWDGIKGSWPTFVSRITMRGAMELLFFIAFSAVAIQIGVWLQKRQYTKQGEEDAEAGHPSPSPQERKQSTSFVLEVDGSQPIDGNSDWRFFLTNCTTRTLRYVQLSSIRSRIGAYEIAFKELPVLTATQKAMVSYEVLPLRHAEVYGNRRATLWDFAQDYPAGGGETNYFWHDISVQYRDDDDSVRNGGLLGVCFDLANKKLKTEGAEYWRKNNYDAMFAESSRKLRELERNLKDELP